MATKKMARPKTLDPQKDILKSEQTQLEVVRQYLGRISSLVPQERKSDSCLKDAFMAIAKTTTIAPEKLIDLWDTPPERPSEWSKAANRSLLLLSYARIIFAAQNYTCDPEGPGCIYNTAMVLGLPIEIAALALKLRRINSDTATIELGCLQIKGVLGLLKKANEHHWFPMLQDTFPKLPLRAITPEGFIDHGDGTLTDLHSGLMWYGGFFGQTWSKALSKWSGDAAQWEPIEHGTEITGSYQQAEQAVTAADLNGYSDWRMPTANDANRMTAEARAELGSIIQWEKKTPPNKNPLAPPRLRSSVYRDLPKEIDDIFVIRAIRPVRVVFSE